MGSSKFTKTPKLGVVLQLTELAPGATGERLWEIHDVERGRGFRVSLKANVLGEAPGRRKKLARPFTEAEIEGAIGLAIERALVSPPEKVVGPVYDVDVTTADLYDFVFPQS